MSGDRKVRGAMPVFGPLKLGDCNMGHGCSPPALKAPLEAAAAAPTLRSWVAVSGLSGAARGLIPKQ